MSWSCEPYTDEDLNYSDDNSCVSHNISMKDCEMWNWRLIPDDWQDVEKIYLGYPVWWGIEVWPINAFVEANDFTGKTVIPSAHQQTLVWARAVNCC